LSVVVRLFLLLVVLGFGLTAGSLEDKRDAKKKASADAAAALARAENSIEGAWWIVSNDGNTYGEPRFIVTRKGNHFDVKSYAHLTVRDIQATKTTLKFAMYSGGEHQISFDLHCQGKFLVGMWTNTIRGTQYTNPTRMVRKPWTGAQ
jgi:hypothetical protein